MWETERRSAAMRSGILALVHAAAAQALASSEALDARRPKNCRTKWCRIQAAMLAEAATRRSQFAAAENMAPPSARFRSALRRDAMLSAAQLERGVALLGDTRRFGRKLRAGSPYVITVLGSSNAVRGGCVATMQPHARCKATPYTNRSEEGIPAGWLLQAWEALNRLESTVGKNVLINNARMASPPEAFSYCLDKHVPLDTDAVVLSFADMCYGDSPSYVGHRNFGGTASIDNLLTGGSHDTGGPVLPALEAIVRHLLYSRADPPAILLLDFERFAVRRSTPGPAFARPCDAAFHALAAYYRLSRVSVRDAIWHEAITPGHRLHWQRWMSDDGLHLNLAQGDRLVAELLLHWAMRVAEQDDRRPLSAPPPAVPWLTADRRGTFGPHARRLTSLAAVCVTFDSATVPSVLAHDGWRFVELDSGVDAATGHAVRKPKPGFKATARGARLVLNTTRGGVGQSVRLGFLRTYSSTAVAQARCAAPCRCKPTNLTAHTPQNVSTTQFESIERGVSTPSARETCTLEVELLTEGQEFKMVSMHVY